ncbi:hypothetical protein B296_00021667 [Ensete ventricosum]|uniref:Uncharacterized protein n=1 Tax=Ensete ventricosum TaxID=4639 RepID=A0A426ZTQ8_ENSVE|nr:hypothetical protein B296_00021667 [Ensete ventricosum]
MLTALEVGARRGARSVFHVEVHGWSAGWGVYVTTMTLRLATRDGRPRWHSRPRLQIRVNASAEHVSVGNRRKPPAVLPRFFGLRSLRWSLIPAWVLVAAPRGDLVGGSELMNSRDVCNDGIDYRERPLYPSFSQITSNLRVFTFSELRNATRNFSRSLMVGEGRRNRDEGEKRMVRWDRLLGQGDRGSCGRGGADAVAAKMTAAAKDGEAAAEGSAVVGEATGGL